jgi:hypothetical protein
VSATTKKRRGLVLNLCWTALVGSHPVDRCIASMGARQGTAASKWTSKHYALRPRISYWRIVAVGVTAVRTSSRAWCPASNAGPPSIFRGAIRSFVLADKSLLNV